MGLEQEDTGEKIRSKGAEVSSCSAGWSNIGRWWGRGRSESRGQFMWGWTREMSVVCGDWAGERAKVHSCATVAESSSAMGGGRAQERAESSSCGVGLESCRRVEVEF